MLLIRWMECVVDDRSLCGTYYCGYVIEIGFAYTLEGAEFGE